jgi:predicted amidohydrolase YtcJ
MTTPAVDLIIKGGQVVTSTDVIDAAVAVKGGAILAVGPRGL